MYDPSDDSSEVLLEPQVASALQSGLATLPTPEPQTRFNSQVLNLLTSGREFASWPQQALLRLRWMLIPLVLGFVLTFALAVRVFRPLPAPEEYRLDHPTLHAPALTPLPDLQPVRKHPAPAHKGE